MFEFASPDRELSVSDLRQEFERFVEKVSAADTRGSRFISGCAAPMIGLRFALARRDYLRLMIVPVLIQTIISTLLVVIVGITGWVISGWVHSAVIQTIQHFRPNADLAFIEEWGHWIIVALVGVAMFYLFIVVWRVTGGIIADYWADRLTNRLMTDLQLNQTPVSTSLAGTILDNLKAVGSGHAAMLLVAPLGVVPLIGPLLVVAVGCVVMMFVHGSTELSGPLQTMGYSNRAAWKLCWRQKFRTVGLAASKMVVGPVPAIGGLAGASESIGRVILATAMDRAENTSGPPVSDAPPQHSETSECSGQPEG